MSSQTRRTEHLVTLGMDSPNAEWIYPKPGTAYSCEVHIAFRPGGDFLATAARLPSLTATGLTEASAKDAIRSRLVDWLRSQQMAGDVQWAETKRQPLPGELVRVLSINLV